MTKVYNRLWSCCLLVLSTVLMCLSRANAEVLVIGPDDLGPSHWGTCWSCEVERDLYRNGLRYEFDTETDEVHVVYPEGTPDENGQPRSEPERILIPISEDWRNNAERYFYELSNQSRRVHKQYDEEVAEPIEESVDNSSSNTNSDASFSPRYY